MEPTFYLRRSRVQCHVKIICRIKKALLLAPPEQRRRETNWSGVRNGNRWLRREPKAQRITVRLRPPKWRSSRLAASWGRTYPGFCCLCPARVQFHVVDQRVPRCNLGLN